MGKLDNYGFSRYTMGVLFQIKNLKEGVGMKTLVLGLLLFSFLLILAWPSLSDIPTIAASVPTNVPSKVVVEPTTAVSGHISPVFKPAVQYWSDKIVDWAGNAGLDPNMVATVMQIESCGDPKAVSSVGAIGLFQVMPGHFTASDDPYEPSTNALRGLAYLKRSLNAAGGNPRLGFAGYNGGIGVIGRAESSWAAQTQKYAYWGSGIYADATSGVTTSPRLEEWFRAQGVSLCHQAANRLGIQP